MKTAREAFVLSLGWKSTWMLLAVVTTLAIWLGTRRRNKISKRGELLVDKLPGPMALPILGNALNLYGENEDFLNLMGTLCNKWGGLYRIWYFNNPWVMVTTVDDVQKLYSSPSAKKLNEKSFEIDALKVIGGNALYNRDGNTYHERRKVLNLGYGISLVRKGVPKANYGSNMMVKTFQRFAESGESVNLYPVLTHSTIQFVWDSLFAKRFEDDHPDVAKFIHSMSTFSFNESTRLFKPWLRSDFIYNLTKGGKQASKATLFLNDFQKRNVKERRIIWEKKKALSQSEENVKEQGDWECFADYLLEQEQKGVLTEQDVCNECQVFTVGGFETSAITMTLFIWLLALNPECQKRVVEELDEIFGEGFDPENIDVTMNQVKELKYMDLCLKEVLRLYPPLAVSPKRTTQDIQLEDGRVIPAGVQLYIWMYFSHRDPKYFPNPEAFIPDRFSAESEFYREKPTYAYIPFSVLPRSCIGQNYALMSIKLYMAYLLKAFEWTAVTPRDKLSMTFQYGSHPNNAIVNVKSRSK